MLKYLPLITSNLGRKRLRTIFTVGSISMAFLLFGMLESFRYGLYAALSRMEDSQLITISSTFGQLPLAYVEQISTLPGVRAATGVTFVPIVLGDEIQLHGALAVDAPHLLTVIPELRLSPDERDVWLNERRAALVGIDLARKHGWKKGDLVALKAQIYTQKDGGHTWPVVIAGIFNPITASPSNDIFFHYDYLNESLAFGRNVVSYILSRCTDPGRSIDVAHSIDSRFRNSPAETRTTSLKAYAQRGINQLGHVGTIILAVMGISFFTMLLIATSAMSQAVRERRSDFAVMMTVGYPGSLISSLVVVETLLIISTGGLIGILTALYLQRAASAAGQSFLPLTSGHLLVTGALVVLVCTCLTCIVPLLQTSQNGIATALQKE